MSAVDSTTVAVNAIVESNAMFVISSDEDDSAGETDLQWENSINNHAAPGMCITITDTDESEDDERNKSQNEDVFQRLKDDTNVK